MFCTNKLMRYFCMDQVRLYAVNGPRFSRRFYANCMTKRTASQLKLKALLIYLYILQINLFDANGKTLYTQGMTTNAGVSTDRTWVSVIASYDGFFFGFLEVILRRTLTYIIYMYHELLIKLKRLSKVKYCKFEWLKRQNSYTMLTRHRWKTIIEFILCIKGYVAWWRLVGHPNFLTCLTDDIFHKKKKNLNTSSVTANTKNGQEAAISDRRAVWNGTCSVNHLFFLLAWDLFK